MAENVIEMRPQTLDERVTAIEEMIIEAVRRRQQADRDAIVYAGGIFVGVMISYIVWRTR